MTVQTFRELLSQRPFRLVMSSGQTYEVPRRWSCLALSRRMPLRQFPSFTVFGLLSGLGRGIVLETKSRVRQGSE